MLLEQLRSCYFPKAGTEIVIMNQANERYELFGIKYISKANRTDREVQTL